MNEVHPNQELIDGLQGLIDFLKSGFTLAPYVAATIAQFELTERKFLEKVAHLGTCEKAAEEDYYTAIKRFGKLVQLRITTYREQLCTRRLVGTAVVPATPERIEVFPAVGEHTVEVYEWDCPPSLLEQAAALDRAELQPSATEQLAQATE